MLDINTGTMKLSLINIFIFYLFLKKFLFKPVTEMMDKRTLTITNDLESAKQEKISAEKLYEEYQEKIKNAEQEAAEIIKEARSKADWEYNKRMVELVENQAKLKEEAEKMIALDREKSIKSAQAEIAAIAILATSKIIGHNVDSNMNKQILGDFMKEVGAAQ